MNAKRKLIFVALLIVIGSVGTFSFSSAGSYNTSVDFTQATTALATLPFSSTISTYNAYNSDITQDDAQLTALGNLGAGYYRIPLQWNGGNIISSASGGSGAISGDTWINKIKKFGGQPEIVLGGTSDDNFTPGDAANMVQHFNKPANGQASPVGVWVIGNEPDVPGMSVGQYCTLFNSTVTAMKQVDPTIKVAGPAWSHYDPAVLAAFLQCAGSSLDILDFHNYEMGANSVDTATALGDTSAYEADVDQAYQLIRQYAPGRGIQVQVGEYNWSWTTSDGYNGWQGDDRFYQAVNTVWGASVAGHIAAAGGRGDEYADLNGALGLTFEQEDAAQHYGQSLNRPMPIYYGLEMFTGGNLFRGFGPGMVASGTQLSNVEIFAASSGNIVMINKSPTATQTATIGLTGFSGGSADVWQTNQNAPFSQPAQMATINVTNSLSYPLPPYSVTTFVLNGGTGTGSPSPSPSGSPAPSVSPTPSASPTPSPSPSPGANTCEALDVRQGSEPGHYTFTAGTTTGGGMAVTGYHFNFGDGSSDTTTQGSVNHIYGPGTYSASVSVDFSLDGMTTQLTSQACETIVTVGSQSPPVGSSPPSAPEVANTCTVLDVRQGPASGQYTFTAKTTATGGGKVAGYDFNFGDGSTDSTTQGTVSHGYGPGTYPAAVSVDFRIHGMTTQVTSLACETTVSVVDPPPGTVLSAPLRINVGGGPYTDPAGDVWHGDEYYSGGSADNQAAGRAIKDTTMAPLLQNERWGNFSYQLPIANGTYNVRLYFAEVNTKCRNAGCRVFNVTDNGSPWLTNFDIAAKVGDYQADVETKTVTVTNNILNLAFTSVVGSPQIAAIEVES